MRVNWFCPLPPADTDVARYGRRILPELAAAFDLTLWTSQEEWDRELERFCPVRRFDPRRLAAAASRTGLDIYHLGNNVEFHADIWDAFRQRPGIAVMHDLTVFEFMAQYHLARRRPAQGAAGLVHRLAGWRPRIGAAAALERLARRRRRERFFAVLRAAYGEAAVRLYEAHERGALPIARLCERFPFTREACRGALGILGHSREAPALLALPPEIPVAVAPLPYRAGQRTAPPAAARLGGGGPYRLVIFGYVAANRRVEAVLEALAAFPARERFTLDIYGRLFIEREVREAIARLGLGDRVRLHGFVDDDTLDRALDAAHLVVNLRHPSMGEASGSLLRSWDHALPSLVTRTRWYATLPEETVGFVGAGEAEREDLHAHLAAFLADPLRYARMGEAGRAVLERDHAPAAYVRALGVLCAEIALEADAASRHLLDRAAAEAPALVPEAGREAWLRQAAARLAEILPLPGEGTGT